MAKKGFVYVMSNKSMPGLIKVGMSTKVPEERAKELSSDTSTPTPFIVEYYALFDDMQKAERLAHQGLQQYHHGKEFFETNVAQAIQAIESLTISYTRLFSKADNDEKVRMLQDKLNLEKKKENERVLLNEFASQKEQLKKLIKEYPKSDDIFTNYSTNKIVENYNNLAEIFSNLKSCSGSISKQYEDISVLHKGTVECMIIEKKQKHILVDNISEEEKIRAMMKDQMDPDPLGAMFYYMKWVAIIVTIIPILFLLSKW